MTDKWRPIADAPEGEVVLVCEMCQGVSGDWFYELHPVAAKNHGEYDWWTEDSEEQISPTHFRELPLPEVE